MNHEDEPLAALLKANPHITLAYLDHNSDPHTLHIHFAPSHTPTALLHRQLFPFTKTIYHIGPFFHDLRTRQIPATPTNIHQKCQNEPIHLGTQVQPAGANWVGTAGSPISWTDPDGKRHWGFLSNYHVLVPTDALPGHAIHQPDTRSPPIARLSKALAPSPTRPNYVDAALADTLCEGYHTTAWSILDLPPIDHSPKDAVPNEAVTKVGRTSARTDARCKAIGAAVRVSYGNYTAAFVDQDLYEDTDAPFSAPGDSGSLILNKACNCPTSLLFAGGANLTVGNPIRHVLKAFNATFDPN